MLPVLALVSIVFGLSFQLHKNAAFFVFTLFFILSDVVNPVFFINNEKMYRESPWGYVKDFDFSFNQLLLSYVDSEFIFLIITALMLVFFAIGRKMMSGSAGTLPAVTIPEIRLRNEKSIAIGIICLIGLNFLLYHYRLGITGLQGGAPYHLFGLTHYVRSYFLPVVFALLLGKYTPNKFIVILIFIYAFLAGIASASRFVAVIPVLILMYNFYQRKKYGLIAFSIVYCVLLWLTISTSRILTFSKERYDMLHVIYFSLTENSGESIVGFFDLISGRLSGSQQVVLAYQLKGLENCNHIVSFFLGDSICTNTALEVFNLDLSGTGYGIGLSVIPSIIISSTSRWDYILPSLLIGVFLILTNIVYKYISKLGDFPMLAYLYLIFSCIFLFAGPLRFFYYLHAATLVMLCILTYWRKKRCGPYYGS
ncbi:hypothetical protein [Rhodoferax sp.]|uniref:hypothetical protein n=1 Tax=Rhodoferax sp. TaxID=50421 RepID=UPI002733464F|nr:hypothetical protein [Rhodoferax sp.]